MLPTLSWTRVNPWSWGIGAVFYSMDRNLLSTCAIPRRMIFCSSLMLLVVCWHFPICIIIIIIIIIISLIVPSFLLTNAWMFHFVLKKKTGYNHKNILKVKRLNLTSLFQWHWCPLWLTFLSNLEIHSLCTFFQLYLSQQVLWQGHSDDQKVVKW